MVVMKQNFTKISFLFFALILSQSLFAQFPFLVNVDGVDEELVFINTVSFGACIQDAAGISAEFALADPANGCEAITSDLTGRVAIIDRGSCFFIEKARSAEAAGAIAAVICNNLPSTDPNGGLINLGLGDDDMDDVTIPVFSATQEDCALIRVQLPANGTIAPPPFEAPSGEVVWGDMPGQGDFDGGLNGWTTTTLDCNGVLLEVDTWTWDEDGVADLGSFSRGFASGPTFCNGFMVFDSDFLDNGGNAVDENGNTVDASFGAGDCPAPQVGELLSPVIDLSASDAAGVSLEFWQDTRQFDSQYFVEYSLDGGETFTFVPINEELDFNENTTEFRVSVPLPGAAGSDQLRIKFTYFANYYYWAIDDVKIVEREANNIRVNENFFATAPNVLRPRSQVEPINFLADIQNVGAATQDNVTLSVSVTNDADGTEVFSDAVNLGSITADSLAENNLFPNQFTPADEIANYTGVYTVSSDAEDFDQSDNSRTFNFGISQDEFANESGPEYGNVRINDTGQIPTWALGNYFYVPNGDGWRVTRFGIGVSNAAEVGGLDVGIRMFKWEDQDLDSDGSGFPEAAPNERELVGFADYEILGNELPADINFVDVDDPDDPILLENDAHYIVMMTMDAVVGVSARDELFDSYLAMNLASTEAGMPRYWSFFGDSDDIGSTVYDALTNFTPLVRMYIARADGTSTTELPADNLVEISPNPAIDYVLIDMDFTKSFDDVEVMITDVTGRVVLMRELENIQQHQMRVDISNLMNGTFTINIRTPEGIRTEKFVKID